MSKKQRHSVAIVGTSHSLQVGLCGDSLAHEFTEFLSGVCDRVPIRAIAEELSAEALVEKGRTTSLAMRVAQDRGLPHRLCDPSQRLRANLGIRQENDLALSPGWKSLSQAQRTAHLKAEDAKRERYWLEQLRELDVWPVLFVCGAFHVSSFVAILGAAEIASSVEILDWPVDI